MSPPYFLFICMAAVAVKEDCADSVPTPTIVLDPGYINVAMPVVVRCESTGGTKCQFYKDHDPNPIREVNSGVCQFILFWNEFKKWNKTEVDLSCAILQKGEGKIIPQFSDARRLHVSDSIGIPRIFVENTGTYLSLRCEAKHAGTSCYYYLNNSDSPFKSQPYKDNVCVGRVAEEELQRKRSSAGEIFITCAVELVMEGENTVKSQHSEPFKIAIDVIDSPGPTTSLSTFSTNKTSVTKGEESSSEFPLYISLSVGAFSLILLVVCVLCFLRYKRGDQQDWSADRFQWNQNKEGIYANASLFQQGGLNVGM
ncbi:uncharacterized protein LOC115159624 isoform X1 [Salmo trutta]|uniref:uncharacterized protein LOC115159624 isoform X1 n=1 Tax=Salmo trutta TaxID=8032 RepID=UPI0011316171|nr:uncharacterized protein LOC115159624 isoform X1 [Salmo trutta]